MHNFILSDNTVFNYSITKLSRSSTAYTITQGNRVHTLSIYNGVQTSITMTSVDVVSGTASTLQYPFLSHPTLSIMRDKIVAKLARALSGTLGKEFQRELEVAIGLLYFNCEVTV